MSKAKYNQNHKKVLDSFLLEYRNVKSEKMFGYPAFYAGKKLCICLYENGVGLKIPEEQASEILQNDKNSKPFQPMGKSRMREWIQIDLRDSEGYLDYKRLFEDSINYVLSLQDEGVSS